MSADRALHLRDLLNEACERADLPLNDDGWDVGWVRAEVAEAFTSEVHYYAEGPAATGHALLGTLSLYSRTASPGAPDGAVLWGLGQDKPYQNLPGLNADESDEEHIDRLTEYIEEGYALALRLLRRCAAEVTTPGAAEEGP